MANIDISCYFSHVHQMERFAMQSMNISLPDPLKAFVDGQVSTGRYSSASEYMRELIREDEKRKAQDQLEALLLDGLRGETTPLTAADFQAVREEAIAVIKAREAGR
jgi:antitoxin ParD1/3/4